MGLHSCIYTGNRWPFYNCESTLPTILRSSNHIQPLIQDLWMPKFVIFAAYCGRVKAACWLGHHIITANSVNID